MQNKAEVAPAGPRVSPARQHPRPAATSAPARSPAKSPAKRATKAAEKATTAASPVMGPTSAPATNGTPAAEADSPPSSAPVGAPKTEAPREERGADCSPTDPSPQQAEPLRRSASALRRASAERSGLSVHFKSDSCTFVEVPLDQTSPMDVWNVYSPVRYITKKEKRALDNQRRVRTTEIVEYCASLFESEKIDHYMEKKQVDSNGVSVSSSPRQLTDRSSSDHFRRNEERAVAASFIMSMWNGFPVESRPLMSIEVEAAFPHLSRGTYLCIFNEENESPLRCTAALRLLRNVDGDEGSVAIYNQPDLAAIDGYIPLCFLHSVTRGLESIERHRYVNDGVVKCKTEDGNTIHVSHSRAFTLHCRAPQRFYVSFIALTDKDLDRWIRVLTYFVFLNSQCRAYYTSRSEE